MYPENLKETQVIVGSMNMGYDIYPTLPGIELTSGPISLGHSDGQIFLLFNTIVNLLYHV